MSARGHSHELVRAACDQLANTASYRATECAGPRPAPLTGLASNRRAARSPTARRCWVRPHPRRTRAVLRSGLLRRTRAAVAWSRSRESTKILVEKTSTDRGCDVTLARC